MNEFLLMPAVQNVLVGALEIAGAGAGICAVVLVAARLLGRRSAPLTYGILMAGIVGLHAVPALILMGHVLPTLLDWPLLEQVTEVLKVPAERLPELLDRPVSNEAPRETDVPLAMIAGLIITAAWVLGGALLLVRRARAFVKGQRVLMGQPWHAAFWNDDMKTRLARSLGLKAFPNVYMSPVTPMPMVIGIWRPKILLPAEAPATWGTAQWQAILLHEGAHIARRDHWAVPAQRLAVLLFWWCPLVYFIGRRLNDLRECICDDYALQGSCDAFAYAEVLVESAECLLKLKTVPVALALLNSAQGGLEARVTRLLEKERKPMTKLSRVGKLGAGLFVAACLMTTTATAISWAQPAAPKKIQIKIIIDGKEIDLGDPRLWEHIENANRRNTTTRTVTDVQFNKAAEPVVNRVDVRFADVNTPTDKQDHFLFLVDPKNGVELQLKFDPRVEQLIKAAEAIKAGSGAEVRKALEAVRKAGDKATEHSLNLFVEAGGQVRKAVVVAPKLGDKSDQGGRLTIVKPESAWAGLTVRLTEDNNAANWTRDLEKVIGKKVIVITTKDGKMVQLPEADLKKLLENANKTTIKTKPKANEKNRSGGQEGRLEKSVYPLDQLIIRDLTTERSKPVKQVDLEKVIRGVYLDVTGTPPSPQKVETILLNNVDTRKAPATGSKDIEALRARIEQLSAEIRVLSERLNANKK